jgi:hypothetical protein
VQKLEDENMGHGKWGKQQALQRDIEATRRGRQDLKKRLSVKVLERNHLVQMMATVQRGLDQVEQKGLSQEEMEEATEGRDAAMGEDADCQICLAPMVPGEATLSLRRCACRRAFHAACLARWLKDKDSCPLCRGPARGWE